MAYGLQIGVTKDKLEEATKGAIGLSKAYEFDLQTAMKLVGMGLEGEYAMLSRNNVALRTAATESEKAAVFQKMLADGFEFAETKSKGFGGQLAQLDITIREIKKQFGFLLRDFLKPVITALNNEFIQAVAIAGSTMLALAVPVYALTTAFTALSAAVTASTGGLNLVIAAIAATATGLIALDIAENKETTTLDKNTESRKNNTSSLEDAKKARTDLNTAIETSEKYLTELQAKQEDERIVKARENRTLVLKEIDENIQAVYRLNLDGAETLRKIDKLNLLEQEENLRYSNVLDLVSAEEKKKNLEAEIKAAQEAADKKLELEKQYYIDLLEAEQNYKDQRDAMKETLPELAPEGAGIAKSEYTPEMQLADQQIVDELLLEEARIFSAQILDIDTATHEARLQALANEKISYDQYQSLELESKAKTEKAKQALNKQTALNGAKDMLANLQALKSLGKEAAAVAKAAAIASTTIDTIDSAQKSYKWGASWGGPFGGAAMAAIALAAGYARVAQITATATGFQSGGYTGTGQDDEVAGVAHKNEVIIPAPVVRKIGIDRAISIAAGVASVPDFAGSETSNGLNNISGRLGALNANIVNQDSVKETFIINNSDFVEITKEIEKTKSNHPGIMDNKYLGAF